MSNKEDICCTCLTKSRNLENILDTDETNVSYLKKLNLCIPNEVWLNSYKLCKECCSRLKSSYNYINMCITSHIQLEKVLKNHSKTYFNENCGYQTRGKTCKYENGSNFQLNDVYNGEVINKFIEDEAVIVENLNNKSELSPNIDCVKPEDNKYLDYIDVQQDFDDDSSCNDEIKDFNDSDVKEFKISVKKKIRSRSKGPHTCKYCNEVFKLVRLLQTHISNKHKSVRPFSCDQCDATYKTNGALIIHKRTHTGERPYVCTECGKSFRAGADLIRHTKIHSAKRAYQCQYCEKSFKTSGNLHMHKSCVHKNVDDYKFQCNECGHKFPFKGHLDNHLKRHEGVKNFVCHICESKFILNSELDMHVRRVHRNEELSKCPECQKEFKTLCGQRKHLKLAHNIGNFKYKAPERKFLCPYCPKRFPYNNKLQRHILTHTGEKPFKCETCGKGFRDNFNLNAHLTNSHNS